MKLKMNISSPYCKRNKEKLQEKANNRYHQAGGKEKTKYYCGNKLNKEKQEKKWIKQLFLIDM